MREVLPPVDEVVDSAIPYFSAVSARRASERNSPEALAHFYEAAVAVGENPALRLAYLGLLISVSEEQRTHSIQVVREIEGEILLDDRHSGLINPKKYKEQLDDLEDPEVLEKRAIKFVEIFMAVIPKEELDEDVVNKLPIAIQKKAEEERIKNIPQDTDIHLNIDKSTGLFVSGNNKTPDLDDAERAVLDSLISEALEHRSVRVAASIIKRNRIFRQITAGLSAHDANKLFSTSMKNLRSKLWEEGLGNLIETTGEGYQRAYRINPNLHIHKVTEGQQRTWGQAPVAGEYRAPAKPAEKKSNKKEIQWTAERVAIATSIVKQLRDLGSTRSGLVPVSRLFENTTLDAESITSQEFNRVARLLEKAGIALTNAHTTARQKRQGGSRFSVGLVQDNELVKGLLKDDDAPLLEFFESLISSEPN